MVPLLPAFEGNVGDSAGNAMRAILHFNYASITRGPTSLFARLEAAGVDPANYLSFCSLRTWSELCGVPVTELVYIHSKLTIVDDEVVICGSANINDRSLLGNRDSEVCLRFQDTEFVDIPLSNGMSFKSGLFAGKLRRHLMREHLGLLPFPLVGDSDSIEDVGDCISDSFFHDKWNKVAASNTELFEQVFLCTPSDSIPTMEECRDFQSKTPMAEIDRYAAKQILKGVKVRNFNTDLMQPFLCVLFSGKFSSIAS